MKKQLVLVGAGHCHLLTALSLVKDRRFNTEFEITLVSNSSYQIYSGMLPGWIAGYYQLDELRIDVAKFCADLGIHFSQAEITTVDTDEKRIYLNGTPLSFDVLSFNVGSSSKSLEQEPFLSVKPLAVKPLEDFYQQIDVIQPPKALAVIGAGAAAVELALAFRSRFPEAKIDLLIRSSLLKKFPKQFQTKADKELSKHAVGLIKTHNAFMSDYDYTINATGSQAHYWQPQSGLTVNESGYFLIHPTLQSTSDDNVFAVGDCSSMEAIHYDKSGVHAVRQAPYLIHNIQCQLFSGSLKSYQPQQRVLYLLASTNKCALGVYGVFNFYGRWVWLWKRWLDTDFIKTIKKASL